MKDSLTFLTQTDNFIKRHQKQTELLKTIIDKNNIKINKLFNLLPSENTYSDTYFAIELEIQDLLNDNEQFQSQIEIITDYYIVGFKTLKQRLIYLNQHHTLHEDNSIPLYNHICKNIFALNLFNRVYLDSSFVSGLSFSTINILKNTINQNKNK